MSQGINYWRINSKCIYSEIHYVRREDTISFIEYATDRTISNKTDGQIEL